VVTATPICVTEGENVMNVIGYIRVSTIGQAREYIALLTRKMKLGLIVRLKDTRCYACLRTRVFRVALKWMKKR
jgi:hypothetical protein